MDDLISRSMAVKIFQERSRSVAGMASKVYRAIAQELEKLPTVDAKPVQRGKWIHHDDDIMPRHECSYCGFQTFDADVMNYYPTCGAKMDGGEI